MISKLVSDSLIQFYDWWISNHEETIYAFAFYSTPLLESAGCVVMTEEGLNKVTEEYRSRDYFHRKQPKDYVSDGLRWSPPDSPYVFRDKKFFGEADSALKSVSKEFYDLEDDAFEEAYEKVVVQVLGGINRFREERLPKSREDVLVTMFWGDMSESEDHRFIRACNNEHVLNRYIEETRIT